MPLFKVQLKEGSKVDSRVYESKDYSTLLTFLENNSTMQVTEICEIVYKSDFDKRKDDPSQYFQLYKAFISNKGKLLSSQIFIPHLKNDSVASISDDIQNSLLVGGYSVTSITNQIF